MLKGNHGLENQDFYRYLQLRHYAEHAIRDVSKKVEHRLLKVFLLAYQLDVCKNVISRLYSGLQEAKMVDTLYIKERWEREGNLSLSVEEWERVCVSQWKTTYSLFWREFAWKGVARFFSTPAQIKHQSYRSNCWRKCGVDKANHFHIFWGCTSIKQYWYEKHKCPEIILKIHIPFSFEVPGIDFQ